jgi:hypothetical protein
MTNLSSIIVTLVLLQGSSKLSIDERAAVGCAKQILVEVERLNASVDALSKEYFYSTHPEHKKPVDFC